MHAHSDMVCVSNNEYDFEDNGIDWYIDGDVYKAHNTSLGADDGIGVAIILAMLQEKENMPNIEVVITSQEETTMNGAYNFDYSLLCGKILISLDGIKEGDIESSSAGMCSATLKKNLNFVNITKERYKLEVTNLAGGHSGDDIDKNRCNGVKLVSSILNKIGDVEISDIDIGIKDNVIPNSGFVIFSSKYSVLEIKQIINEMNFDLVKEDKNVKININKIDEKLKYKSIKNSKDIIDFLCEIDDGLLEVYEDDEFPKLSSNIGKIMILNKEMNIEYSIRSGDEKKLETQILKLKALCDKYKFIFNFNSRKPVFPFNENSKIRNLLKITYKELYNKEAVIKKIHACMELGIIYNKIENIDVCTIAPDVLFCHSVNEEVSISSTKRVYAWLKLTLQKFNEI